MMSTDMDMSHRSSGGVQEGVFSPPLTRRSSHDTPPQPPSRTRYYDMSPQVPRRSAVANNNDSLSSSRRSPNGSSRSPRRGPGSRRSNYRRSGSSKRSDQDESLENSNHSTASSNRRQRSRSSSRHRRSRSGGRRSRSGGRRSSNSLTSPRRMRRSESQNQPGAYKYYDDIDDHAEAVKAKQSSRRSSSTGRRSPRRSELSSSSRRSPPSDPDSRQTSFSRRSPQPEEPKIYDDAFGDCPKTTAKKKEIPITPTSVLTETSNQEDMSDDEEIVLPGAYASNLEGDDLRLSRLHGRSKARRSRNHMRVSMGGLDPPLMDSNSSSAGSSSMTSAERSALEARKDSRRSSMMRAASERNRSSRRLLVRQHSASPSVSANSNIAIATAIRPAVSESESEEDIGEEIVNDEYFDHDYDNDDLEMSHQTTSMFSSSQKASVASQSHRTDLCESPDASESTATGSISEDVVTEIVKPNKFRRNNKRNKKEQSQRKMIQRRQRRERNYCLVAVFLLIVGGGTIYLLLRPDKTDDSSSSDIASNSNLDNNQNPTSHPSAAPSAAVETLPPTESYLYHPPSPQDCIAMKNDEMIIGQGNMTNRNFNLHFDVVLDAAKAVEIDSVLKELLEAIESYFVPSLAGCDDIMSSTKDNDGNRRRLALLRYVVANADVDGEVSVDESCTTTPEQPCFRVVVNLKVYLKGNVRIAQLLNLIVGVVELDGFKGVSLGNARKLEKKVDAAPVLAERWNLSDVFKGVVLARIESANAASSAPSMVPSISPSTSAPSSSPSASPSAQPSSSDAPFVVKDTTTSSPVVPNVASQGPTAGISIPPTSTDAPVPSAAPTRTSSVAPTIQTTTQTPTREPTETPSEVPTSKPSTMGSALPSRSPTASPTDKPSVAPSPVPSGSQSEPPTAIPTMSPSAEPSWSPSSAPTLGVSDNPTPAPVPESSGGGLPGGGGLSSPTEPPAEIITVEFDDLPTTDSGECLGGSPTAISGTYENIRWNNFGVMDATCFGCYGPSCPNAVKFAVTSPTVRKASFESPTERTFDLFSMWVYNPVFPFTLTGYAGDRTTQIHFASYPYVGTGWHQLDLSAFKNVAVFVIENTGPTSVFDIAFDAIQIRFN
ncbi:unnamed protein product [Cylindrotheca closterium]|uniref:Uncharacterized protein n=1 Tax=Cylindrotheca closterium TaxID=2856 RepID=A0AAD2FNC4_9STRA|nr:unnamed protein product [Cylindrotheca closterium]